MFIRKCWYVAAWTHELGERTIMARTIINEPIVFYRTQAGEAVALEDRCCHRFAPLSAGRLEGDDLRCMYHGLKYDPRGTCIEIPGQAFIAPKTRVRAFPVVEKHGWIWIWMGAAAHADPTLIPTAVGPDDPNWTMRSGHMDYAANYLLINDNLTDFTHLSYVHQNSFGASEEFARTRPTVSRIPRGIRVQRWLTDAVRPGSESPLRSMRENADTWQAYDYLAPGILVMRSISYPKGTADRLGRKEPNPREAQAVRENLTSQAVTPMTEKSTRYFYAWGPRCGEGSDALADVMLGVAQKAFAEDRAMIEGQQRIIDFDPDRKERLTSADLGPTQMRRVIDELLAAELESVAAPLAEVTSPAPPH